LSALLALASNDGATLLQTNHSDSKSCGAGRGLVGESPVGAAATGRTRHAGTPPDFLSKIGYRYPRRMLF